MQQNAPDQHLKGVLIAGLGVLCLTPDSLLVRLASADDWTVLFWRGLLTGLTVLVGLAIIQRDTFIPQVRAIGKPGLLYIVLFTVGSILFVLSVNLTKVANTLFIISSSPLIAAIIARVFLKEQVLPRTWIAIATALFGIAIIASGSIDQGEASLLGDLFAVGAAFVVAGILSISRRYRDRSMVPAVALSGLLTALVVLPLASPFAITQMDMIWLGLMGVLVIPLGFGLLTIGPRYIPAPEVSLILLLESVLGPFWVWLVLDESPGKTGLIGGSIVLLTLAITNLRRSKRKDVP